MPHHTPRAKNVIFLYMDGGVSQVDSFDPKPLLTKYDGQPFAMPMEPTQFDNNGNTLGVEFTLTDPVNWEGEWVDVKFYDRMLEFDIQEASCIADLDSTIPGLGK